ncbi:MAG: hypothetical protein IH947_09615 [Bacteroidetes bacterium]|nr:hypothetical protein [Bacteroidota bacterium]
MKSLVKYIWLGLSLLSAGNLFAQLGDSKHKVRVSTVLEFETAYDFEESNLQKTEIIINTEVKYFVSRKIRFTALGRIYSELNDNLEPGKPDQPAVSKFSGRIFLGDRIDLELREFYMDWLMGNGFALRLGKQQIVWGETDGLKLLDVMNPQNFREFILDEFEDSRLPLWSLKFTAPAGDMVDLEFIWIPDLSYHLIPDPKAPYFPRALVPLPPEGVPVQLKPLNKPDNIITDSDVGLKSSAFIGGWDITLNYLFAYDDTPFFNRSISSDTISLQPSFERMHVVGGTFNKAIGSIILRSEIATNIGKTFYSENDQDTNGLITATQFNSAIGLDWLFNETLLSFQYFQDWVPNKKDLFNRKSYEPSITGLVRQEFFNDSFTAELLSIVNLNDGDWLLRPKVKYFLTSSLELKAGADIFGGSSNSLFGQFDNRDRVYFGFVLGL